MLTAVVPGHGISRVCMYICVTSGFRCEDSYCDKSGLFSPESRELVNKLSEALCFGRHSSGALLGNWVCADPGSVSMCRAATVSPTCL